MARRVEQVGSTAVPGLAAKPIVEMVSVDDLEDESSHRAASQSIGPVPRDFGRSRRTDPTCRTRLFLSNGENYEH